MTEHSNTCDLVGFRQGYNAPAVCSCGADRQPEPTPTPDIPALLDKAEMYAAMLLSWVEPFPDGACCSCRNLPADADDAGEWHDEECHVPGIEQAAATLRALSSALESLPGQQIRSRQLACARSL